MPFLNKILILILANPFVKVLQNTWIDLDLPTKNNHSTAESKNPERCILCLDWQQVVGESNEQEGEKISFPANDLRDLHVPIEHATNTTPNKGLSKI